MLHDGPRTLKATQLRQRGLVTHEESHQSSAAQLDLLRERANILRRYGELQHKCQLFSIFSIENSEMMENFP